MYFLIDPNCRYLFSLQKSALRSSPLLNPSKCFWFLEALGLLTHSDALPASEFRLPVRLKTYRFRTQKFMDGRMIISDSSAITCLLCSTLHRRCKWRSGWKVCCKSRRGRTRITGTTCPTAVPSRRDSTVKPKAEKCQRCQERQLERKSYERSQNLHIDMTSMFWFSCRNVLECIRKTWLLGTRWSV